MELLTELLCKNYYSVYPDIFKIPVDFRADIKHGILADATVEYLIKLADKPNLKPTDRVLLQMETITGLINELPSKKAFPKLCSKASIEIKFYQDNKFITNGQQFIDSFHDDPCVFDILCGIYGGWTDAYAEYFLIDYLELEPMLEEVRLFCVDKKIVASTQYCRQKQIDKGDVKKISDNRIKLAEDFYNKNIKKYVDKDIFVADIGFLKATGDPVFIEFNPFLLSDICLLTDDILGKNVKPPKLTAIEQEIIKNLGGIVKNEQ